jgi:hypothetical protein
MLAGIMLPMAAINATEKNTVQKKLIFFFIPVTENTRRLIIPCDKVGHMPHLFDAAMR